MGEPWSFDRHLLLFKRYDRSVSLSNMEFRFVKFWVQLHNLPIWCLSVYVAKSIEETLDVIERLENE